MPRIEHSVYVDRDPASVFAVTNDIDRWTELFDAYEHSEVLRREDAGRFSKLWFRLKNREGYDWRSWRILDHEELIAVSERETPLFPFAFMHLRWTYRPSGHGTHMTWVQDFELDPTFETPVAVMVNRMNEHGRHNQLRLKMFLESNRPLGVGRP
jgi:aromatase